MKNNKGFTLVELLVVIAIIGILAMVAVPALFRNIEKAKIADLLADINAIKSSALVYYAETSESITDDKSTPNYSTGELLPDRDGKDTEAFKILGIESLSDPFSVDSYKIIGNINTGLKLNIIFPDTISENIISALKKANLDFELRSYWSKNDSLIINIIK